MKKRTELELQKVDFYLLIHLFSFTCNEKYIKCIEYWGIINFLEIVLETQLKVGKEPRNTKYKHEFAFWSRVEGRG